MLIRTETQLFKDNDVNTLLLIVVLATMIVGCSAPWRRRN